MTGVGRRAPVVKVVAAVLVALVLLWGLDAGAKRAAHSLLVRDLTRVTGTQTAPTVRIGGGLFLPQVIRGSYTGVDVGVTGLRSGSLRIERLDARLTDVRVPFHDVLVRNVRTIGIGRSEETARLRYTDLNSYLEAAGRPFGVASGGASDRVRLTGTLDVLSTRVQVSALVTVGVQSGGLTIRPVQVQSTPSGLSPALQLLLTQRLTFTVPVTLPFGQQFRGVSCGDDALTVTAGGTGLVLHP